MKIDPSTQIYLARELAEGVKEKGDKSTNLPPNIKQSWKNYRFLPSSCAVHPFELSSNGVQCLKIFIEAQKSENK